jgi:DNA-binding XRE family transcriptional regulator
METQDILLSFTDVQLKTAFGKSLKILREHTGVTQGELSLVSGISRQSLSVYERCEIAPTIMQAYRIVRYFSLTIEDFIAYGLQRQKDLLGENFACICDKYDSIRKN